MTFKIGDKVRRLAEHHSNGWTDEVFTNDA